MVEEIKPLQYTPFLLQMRKVGSYYRLVSAPWGWNPVFLTLDTSLPSPTLGSHHIHCKLLKAFVHKKLKKHFNPDNISQNPQPCLVTEKKNQVECYVHNVMEAFSLFYRSKFLFLIFLFYVYMCHQHILFLQTCRIRSDCFCIHRRLIASSLGISTWFKTKHFVEIIRYSKVFLSRSSTCHVPGTILAIRY